MAPITSQLEAELLREFGPYVPLAVAWRWLCYPSPDAARKGCQRANAPVPAHRLAHRRGQFVATADLARWLTGHGVDSLAQPTATRFPTAPRGTPMDS